jgi:RNA polymerase sigma factor (sigma-70 family)
MSSEAPQTTRQVVETVLLDPQERRKLVGFAHNRYGIPSQEAEDLLQDTALELLRQRQCVQKPRAYVYAVFRARCSRYPGFDWALIDAEEPDEQVTTAKMSQPAEEILNSSLTVRQALGTVSSGCRKLLAAYYIEGQSLKEAAATMSLAHSGVTKTIGRCLKRLRACLIPRRRI